MPIFKVHSRLNGNSISTNFTIVLPNAETTTTYQSTASRARSGK